MTTKTNSTTTSARLDLSVAALENVEETGIDPNADVARMRAGLSRAALLAECLDGAEALPGYSVDWTGDGNTGADGESTSDIRIEWEG